MGKAEVVEAFEKQPTEQQIIEEKQEEAAEIIEAFKNFEIEDDDDYEVVGEGLKEIKKISKDLETRRKTITQPINVALREFNSWFKPAQEVLQNTERVLKKRLAEYVRKREEQSRLAMEAAAQAGQKGDFDAAHEAAKGIVERPELKGITHTRWYDYEIEDLDQVPRRFLSLDHSAVKIYIKNSGKEEPAPVPGLRFVAKDRTIARA